MKVFFNVRIQATMRMPEGNMKRTVSRSLQIAMSAKWYPKENRIIFLFTSAFKVVNGSIHCYLTLFLFIADVTCAMDFRLINKHIYALSF